MYGKNDLRATLKPKEAAPQPATPFKGASYCRFYGTPPSETGELHETWYGRGQNLIVAYSRARPGAVLARADQVDEYALLIPETGRVRVSTDDETVDVEGPSVVFIPPGASRIEALDAVELYRLITTRSADLAALCANADDYVTSDPNVPPFEPWPDPVGGFRIRAYRGDVPGEPGRFGRLYRGSTVMVNFSSGTTGPRDPGNLSPHHHDDFEQYSIATAGDYVHHLRWPWLSDSAHWRADEHAECAAPSVAVIPPPATHTSQGMGDGLNRLADAFSPPRRDFSAREGWVLNAADYPMPEYLRGAT